MSGVPAKGVQGGSFDIDLKDAEMGKVGQPPPLSPPRFPPPPFFPLLLVAASLQRLLFCIVVLRLLFA